MPVSLMPLPYDSGALAPAISAATIEVHHGKHHRGYVEKTNAAIAGTALADAPLEAIIQSARDGDRKLFNNAAQAWNHGFYWASLNPGRTAPAGPLLAAIERDFGSVGNLTAELAKRGADHFASGWIWLAQGADGLALVETHDAETLAATAILPLLVIDLWEHAYYLDRKNLRPDYLRAVVDRALNWDFAAENLERGSAWVYPAG